jgi:RNA polymerase sigma-70 factor (ECF subfamily)
VRAGLVTFPACLTQYQWTGLHIEPTVELSDEAVVRAVLDGQIGLFEVLMRRYNQRMYRVVRGIVRDADEAEDIVQEAYLNAYAHLNQFEGRARFSTWLTKIAVYEALSRARRRGRFVGEGEGEEMTAIRTTEPDPERQAQVSELRALLEGAIDALPPAYRSVFLMREVEQLSTAETAECLDVSEDAIKMRLSRARAMLRADLMERVGATVPEVLRFDGERCDRIVRNVMARLAH